MWGRIYHEERRLQPEGVHQEDSCYRSGTIIEKNDQSDGSYEHGIERILERLESLIRAEKTLLRDQRHRFWLRGYRVA